MRGDPKILQLVVDRITDYLLYTNVQLGASYGVSQTATQRLQQADAAVGNLINAAHVSEVVMGPSTSLLLKILALCVGQTLRPGDEIVVTNCDHEANITPWRTLQAQGIVIKTWQLNPDSLALELEDLKTLLSPRTRLVTLVHASNVLGTINPIKAITQLVHDHGAWVCVDGVGYVPHRTVDVQDWDVDFYVFSFYKVYGPHHAVLYGKRDHLLALPSINHEFIQATDIPYKFQPGGANYELSYGVLGITDYLSQVAGHHYGEKAGGDLRQQIIQAFDLMAVHEERLSDRLLTYLNQHPKVRVIGETRAKQSLRVPTISFTVQGQDSATVPPHFDAQNIGIRFGHFYAKRLIEDLGLASQNGVVRVSMVHYNTLEEVNQLIHHLETIL